MTLAPSSTKATTSASAGGDVRSGDAGRREGQETREAAAARSQRDLVRASLLRCPAR
jgi:hypothetical protein